MFVRRYLWLLLILFQAAFVAESCAGESFSAPYPYYNELGKTHFFSPEDGQPGGMRFSMRERFRDQNRGAQKGSNRSHTSNPWSLPVSRWTSAMPSRPASNEWSNLQVSSQPSYTELNWHQQPSFQPSPRFVTPDILDKLNGRQTQQSFSFNPYKKSYQKGFQQKYRCCQNKLRRMKRQNYTQRTHQQANQPNTQQAYRYSNGSPMSFSMEPGQLAQERLLYMGDTLPTVPDAAISGLPPMTIFEPLPPVLSSVGNGIDWGTNRLAIDPYGDFLQR